jgi:hypothetical protein
MAEQSTSRTAHDRTATQDGELKMARLPAADVFKPSIGLLAKLGSIIVHIEEGSGDDGHHLDLTAAKVLLADPEVAQWIEGMRANALVPVKRKQRRTPT